MNGPERIEQAIRMTNTVGHPALAAFITAGFPQREGFVDLIDRVATAADIVEIGVPFTDPMADGVTIQRSSQVALADGVTLRWILEATRAATCTTPLVLMSYLNPLLAYRIERLATDAVSAGVSGFIIPDLPFEESESIRDVFDKAGLALIQLVTPVTPEDRLGQLCRASRGFVYAVTTTGITGGGGGSDFEAAARYLQSVKDLSPIPVLAGFGIRSAAQLNTVAEHTHGGIVGSALIEVLDRGDDPVAFLRSLRPSVSQENGDRK